MNKMLFVVLAGIITVLISSLLNEPPNTTIQVINAAPQNLPNSDLYSRVLKQKQMQQPVTFLIVTTKDIPVKEYKAKNIPVYRSRIEGCTYRSEIFANEIPPEFSGTQISL
ncbi:hypothetical protein HGA64_02220 [Candidatus Falkowbacteria bacterium]|nr:hypothetical protein [Candidatus Falkowbacteria bacterium]